MECPEEQGWDPPVWKGLVEKNELSNKTVGRVQSLKRTKGQLISA